LPKTMNMPMPPQRPLDLPRDAGPAPMGLGQRVPEADMNSVTWNVPGQAPPNAVAKVLEERMQQSPQSRPGFSSAAAAPAPAQAPDVWGKGATPIPLDPRQLMPLVAAGVKAKAEQAQPPVQAPESKVPSPTVTKPVPPGETPPPPPSADGYRPSQPSFRGYEPIPPKPAKGDPKSKVKVGDKSNSLYYYTRIGVLPGDNAGVAQRLREIRAKASNPRTATKMTEEEDRILAQYADAAIKKGDDALLMSMEPAAVAKRMEEYRGGRAGGAIPGRYQDRPPGVEAPAGGPVPLKLPPKAQEKRLDAAEKKANQAIQNPPEKTAPREYDDRED
jgi:hypothetical protein